MSNKRRTDAEKREVYDQVIGLLAKGMTVDAACEEVGITNPTYYAYAKKFGDEDLNDPGADAGPDNVTRLHPPAQSLAAVVEKHTTRVTDKNQVGGDHYKHMAIQPLDYILANGLGYIEGNVIKYISRWQAKGGREDIEKARHYCDLLLAHIDAQQPTNEG